MWFIPGIKRTWLGILAWLSWASPLVSFKIVYLFIFGCAGFLLLHLGFPWASLVVQLVKNLPAMDLGSIPGLGRSPEEGKGYPLQYPGLENSVECIVHGVTKSQRRISNFHFHFWLSLVASSKNFSLVSVSWLLIALGAPASVIVALRLSCLTACGIFQDQG